MVSIPRHAHNHMGVRSASLQTLCWSTLTWLQIENVWYKFKLSPSKDCCFLSSKSTHWQHFFARDGFAGQCRSDFTALFDVSASRMLRNNVAHGRYHRTSPRSTSSPSGHAFRACWRGGILCALQWQAFTRCLHSQAPLATCSLASSSTPLQTLLSSLFAANEQHQHRCGLAVIAWYAPTPGREHLYNLPLSPNEHDVTFPLSCACLRVRGALLCWAAGISAPNIRHCAFLPLQSLWRMTSGSGDCRESAMASDLYISGDLTFSVAYGISGTGSFYAPTLLRHMIPGFRLLTNQ